ncbi:MAG: LPS-assembly protein LptD, partial [Saprospiraceae bacterium]|nr:LPS-assembly protein LptD [Saprospiraceae bacterium]
MKSIFYIQFIILICNLTSLKSQVDSLRVPSPVSLSDSLPDFDSVTAIRGMVAFSADTLEDLVTYSARDSIRFDNANHLIYLYGEASIKYQTYSITADFIRVNLDSSIALAEQLPDSLKREDPLDALQNEPEEPEEEEYLPPEDSLGQDTLYGNLGGGLQQQRREENKERNEDGRPYFDDGSTQFTAQRLRYNFKSKKGKVYNVLTEESNMFIHGNETKFVSAGADTAAVDYVYSEDVILTTCNAPHPHYGIHSQKQKIIPNKQVIVGPSNLEIAGVPTPFILPFGFFPISQGATGGLIFPSDYEYSDQWGFGLRDIGYYFPLGEFADLELLSDIYFNGSWGLKARSSYRKRYKYSGNLDIGFSNRIGEQLDPETTTLVKDSRKSFSINWSHTQDQRARPNQTFSASVSMQTSGYDQLNYNDASRVLNNSYSSNIAFRKKFAGSPFSISANARHSQNTRTNEMQFTLPDVNVSMNRIFPFKSKKRSSAQPTWYEKISLQYTGKFLNRIKTQDTLLFSEPLFKNAEFGANHSLNSSASFNLLKYFNITPSVNYDESWYFNTIRKAFDPNVEIQFDTVYNADSSDFEVLGDTLSFGEVLRDTIKGFTPLREYSASLSLSTRIFGSLGVGRKKGWFRGVRHVVKPTISFNFSPDYTNPDLGYVDYVQQDIRDPELIPYSIFEGSLFGSPSQSGRRMALSYSINNLFEAKVFTKKDTTARKIKLFNSISINGSHNFVADSLKWSIVNISGSTQLFKGLSQLNFSMVYDPYDIDYNTGRRINTLYLDSQGKFLRFDRAAVRVSTGLTVDQIKRMVKGESIDRNSSRRGSSNQTDQEEEESITDLFKDFRLSHDLVLMWDVDETGKKNLDIMTNSINTRGNIRISPNWDLSIGNVGYDFRTKRITYPYLGFTRNLHCWEMGFNWAPQRGTY